MVRIEHMDFLLPMKIGELAELTAEIVYTSTHSLLVEIKVHAENIITGNVITHGVVDCSTQQRARVISFHPKIVVII